jgi:ankyrin repeat protein
MLLRSGASPDGHAAETVAPQPLDPNPPQQVPLVAAAESGSLEMVIPLLQAGANPDVADHTGRTPVLAARDAGHEEVVMALLAAGDKAPNASARR